MDNNASMLVFRCPNEHIFTFDIGSYLEPMQALRFTQSVVTMICPECGQLSAVRGSFVIGQNASGQSWIEGFVKQILSEPNARETAQAVMDELRGAQETIARSGEQPDASTVSTHTRGVLERLRTLTPTQKLATIIVVIELLRALIDLSTALTSDNSPSTVYQYTVEEQTVEKQVIRREQPRASGAPPDDELAEYDVYEPLQEAAYNRLVTSVYRLSGNSGNRLDWGQLKPGLFKLLLEVYGQLQILFPGCELGLQVNRGLDRRRFAGEGHRGC